MSFCRLIPIMPRNYKKKIGPGGKLNYNTDYLKNAMEAVKRGHISIRQASEQYAVPYTTLQNRLTKRYSTDQIGRRTALSIEEEHQLVGGLLCVLNGDFP